MARVIDIRGKLNCIIGDRLIDTLDINISFILDSDHPTGAESFKADKATAEIEVSLQEGDSVKVVCAIAAPSLSVHHTFVIDPSGEISTGDHPLVAVAPDVPRVEGAPNIKSELSFTASNYALVAAPGLA